MADNTISLFKLRNKLDAFKLDRFTYSLTDNNSLKLIETPDPKYVDPIFRYKVQVSKDLLLMTLQSYSYLPQERLERPH